MDYKEKYEKLHRFVKDLYPNMSMYCKEKVEGYIPELKESKDEKVRKNCIHFLELQKSHYAATFEIDECIAWLEKQGKIIEEYEDKLDRAICESFDKGYKAALEKQGETFTKRDIDNAFVEGMAFAKYELKKQGQVKESILPQQEEKTCEENDNSLTGEQRVEEAMRYIEEKSKAYMEAHKWESVDKFMAMCRGEQKPIDKVEPKFKVGDWVVNKGHSYLIADIDYEQRRYLFEIGGYTHEQLNWEHIENADKKYHLWTIQDAKKGDVLVSKHNQPFIYNGIFDKDSVGAYCGIDCLGNDFLKDTFSCNWSYKEGVKPATKEQRDLLFQKMKEAGYEWDADKKELKKIEKKSDWSVEDEYTLKDIIEEIEANKSNAPDYDLATYDRFLNWLNSLKERITNN